VAQAFIAAHARGVKRSGCLAISSSLARNTDTRYSCAGAPAATAVYKIVVHIEGESALEAAPEYRAALNEFLGAEHPFAMGVGRLQARVVQERRQHLEVVDDVARAGSEVGGLRPPVGHLLRELEDVVPQLAALGSPHGEDVPGGVTLPVMRDKVARSRRPLAIWARDKRAPLLWRPSMSARDTAPSSRTDMHRTRGRRAAVCCRRAPMYARDIAPSCAKPWTFPWRFKGLPTEAGP
jgi:hypothetical protein